MGINYKELRRMKKGLGEQVCAERFAEAMQAKDIKPSDLSLAELAESLIGEDQIDGVNWVKALHPANAGTRLWESADAVNTSLFQRISGQLVFSTIMEAAMSEEFVFSKIVRNISTKLSGEKIPGISDIGDEAEVVAEGREYPEVGVNETFIETPATTKRGMIVSVTKEAIFFDRTGVLLDRCSKVGEMLGLNKEKRIIDCVVDENSTAHRYKFKGNTIATYGDSSGTHDWDNLEASNALVDWTDIQALELLLAAITDPETGEPIMIRPTHLIVTPQLVHTAKRIVNATNIRVAAGGFATSGNLVQTDGPNTLDNYTILSSRLLAARMATDTSWFLGAPAKAFAYMENWPITVVTAPSNAEAEFERDIVARYKASERGAAATMEPRCMAKATA